MAKQQFKGMKLSRTMVKNNIMKVYEMCEPVHLNDWYTEAKVFATTLAAKYYGMVDMEESDGLPEFINKVVGVLAATSPMKSWDQNKVLTEDFITTGRCGHFLAVNFKCTAIMQSGGTDTEILYILNGRKTQRFYMSINYCSSYTGVTIDRHALSVALGYRISDETMRNMTKRQYEFFEDCYRYAAKCAGITPMLLQSATWQVFRERKNEFEKEK